MFKKILYGILIIAIVIILAMMWKNPEDEKINNLNQNTEQMNLDEQQDQEILKDLDSLDQQMLSNFDNDMKSIDVELNNL